MRNNIVNYSKINFFKDLLITLIVYIFLLLFGFIFAFVLSIDSERSNAWNNIHIFILSISAIVLFIMVRYIYDNKVYIYDLTLENKLLTIKWQEYRKLCETTAHIDNINFELIPYGKNTPYLKLQLKSLKKHWF